MLKENNINLFLYIYMDIDKNQCFDIQVNNTSYDFLQQLYT